MTTITRIIPPSEATDEFSVSDELSLQAAQLAEAEARGFRDEKTRRTFLHRLADNLAALVERLRIEAGGVSAPAKVAPGFASGALTVALAHPLDREPATTSREDAR
jgi:hypothetical protein